MSRTKLGWPSLPMSQSQGLSTKIRNHGGRQLHRPRLRKFKPAEEKRGLRRRRRNDRLSLRGVEKHRGLAALLNIIGQRFQPPGRRISEIAARCGTECPGRGSFPANLIRRPLGSWCPVIAPALRIGWPVENCAAAAAGRFGPYREEVALAAGLAGIGRLLTLPSGEGPARRG